jgi:hypothetical protein
VEVYIWRELSSVAGGESGAAILLQLKMHVFSNVVSFMGRGKIQRVSQRKFSSLFIL